MDKAAGDIRLYPNSCPALANHSQNERLKQSPPFSGTIHRHRSQGPAIFAPSFQPRYSRKLTVKTTANIRFAFWLRRFAFAALIAVIGFCASRALAAHVPA